VNAYVHPVNNYLQKVPQMQATPSSRYHLRTVQKNSAHSTMIVNSPVTLSQAAPLMLNDYQGAFEEKTPVTQSMDKLVKLPIREDMRSRHTKIL